MQDFYFFFLFGSISCSTVQCKLIVSLCPCSDWQITSMCNQGRVPDEAGQISHYCAADHLLLLHLFPPFSLAAEDGGERNFDLICWEIGIWWLGLCSHYQTLSVTGNLICVWADSILLQWGQNYSILFVLFLTTWPLQLLIRANYCT